MAPSPCAWPTPPLATPARPMCSPAAPTVSSAPAAGAPPSSPSRPSARARGWRWPGTSLPGEPEERLAGDVGGHRVGPIELAVPHLVARAPHQRDDAPAARVDGEHLVFHPMGDEQDGLAPLRRRSQ